MPRSTPRNKERREASRAEAQQLTEAHERGVRPLTQSEVFGTLGVAEGRASRKRHRDSAPSTGGARGGAAAVPGGANDDGAGVAAAGSGDDDGAAAASAGGVDDGAARGGAMVLARSNGQPADDTLGGHAPLQTREPPREGALLTLEQRESVLQGLMDKYGRQQRQRHGPQQQFEWQPRTDMAFDCDWSPPDGPDAMHEVAQLAAPRVAWTVTPALRTAIERRLATTPRALTEVLSFVRLYVANVHDHGFLGYTVSARSGPRQRPGLYLFFDADVFGKVKYLYQSIGPLGMRSDPHNGAAGGFLLRDQVSLPAYLGAELSGHCAMREYFRCRSQPKKGAGRTRLWGKKATPDADADDADVDDLDVDDVDADDAGTTDSDAAAADADVDDRVPGAAPGEAPPPPPLPGGATSSSSPLGEALASSQEYDTIAARDARRCRELCKALEQQVAALRAEADEVQQMSSSDALFTAESRRRELRRKEAIVRTLDAPLPCSDQLLHMMQGPDILTRQRDYGGTPRQFADEAPSPSPPLDVAGLTRKKRVGGSASDETRARTSDRDAVADAEAWAAALVEVPQVEEEEAKAKYGFAFGVIWNQLARLQVAKLRAMAVELHVARNVTAAKTTFRKKADVAAAIMAKVVELGDGRADVLRDIGDVALLEEAGATRRVLVKGNTKKNDASVAVAPCASKFDVWMGGAWVERTTSALRRYKLNDVPWAGHVE